MRKWSCIALVGLGCNVIFEENPGFMPDSDGSTAAVTAASDSASTSSESSEAGDEGPTECVGVDMYEPNDSEGQLTLLPGVTSEDVVEISAQLAGAVDEDWFKQALEQLGATFPQPTVSVAAPMPVSVCVYVGCSLGETIVDCGSYTPHTNGANTSGCCGEDEVSASYQCMGAVELDASTYFRVTATGPTEACIPYELTYDFAA